jgi:5-methyltetrahydropteroyltriglutamate--homocysteine methyltransferase
MAVTARADHVGSLLRPSWLLEARAAHETTTLSDAELKAVEDAAVREVVAMQEAAGMPVVTDGELRRESFQSELTAAVSGFAGVGMDAWLWGTWHSETLGEMVVERPAELGVVGRLERRRSLAAEEFTFLRAVTTSSTSTAKVTLPSPTLFSNLWSPDRSRSAYPSLDDFMTDVVSVLVDEVRELRRLGCAYVQLDAPHYPLLVDPTWRSFYESRGWSADRWLSYGVELDNAVIDAAPELTFGFHLCRGNQASRWLVAGGYESIAETIFTRVRADRLLLEYDDERSGTFEPLHVVPDDKVVVLGLVSTKSGDLESIEHLRSRVDLAANVLGRDRLAIGTQCGFSTSVLGNALTIDEERRKLARIVEAAEVCFGTVS